MVDPVFVDTSEGKALVADSLNPPPNFTKIDKEIESNQKTESKKEVLKEEPTIKEEKSTKESKGEAKVENKRGESIIIPKYLVYRV